VKAFFITIPVVFVGAAISATILHGIEDLSAGDETKLLIWHGVHACLISYIGGKIFSYYTFMACNQEYSQDSFLSRLQAKIFHPSLQPYYYHVASESSGFAFKDFVISTLFKLYYHQLGLLATFLYCLVGIVIVIVVIIACEFLQSIIFASQPYMNDYLLEYDTDAFALWIANVLLIVLYRTFGIAPQWSFLYSWNEDEEDDTLLQFGYTGNELIMAFVLLSIVGIWRLIAEIIKSRYHKYQNQKRQQHGQATVETPSLELSGVDNPIPRQVVIETLNRESEERKEVRQTSIEDEHVSADPSKIVDLDANDNVVEDDAEDEQIDDQEIDYSSDILGMRSSTNSIVEQHKRLMSTSQSSESLSHHSMAHLHQSRQSSSDILESALRPSISNPLIPDGEQSPEALPPNGEEDIRNDGDIVPSKRQDATLEANTKSSTHLSRIATTLDRLFVLTSQGYLLGMAFMVLIMDLISIYVPDPSSNYPSLIVLFYIIGVITWRAPTVIRNLNLKCEQLKILAIQAKAQRQLYLKSIESSALPSSSTAQPASQESPARYWEKLLLSLCGYCGPCMVRSVKKMNIYYAKRLYRKLVYHRRILLQIVIRLVVGFCWEVLIFSSFEYLTSADRENGAAVYVYAGFAIAISLFVLGGVKTVHNHYRQKILQEQLARFQA
jgi:hypothetical protein